MAKSICSEAGQSKGLRIVRALSTAVPREQIIHGKSVFTSIVRDPVEGPVFFGEHGPENNKTAVHTEQVLAFSSEHYDFWTRELGVQRSAWPWAFWGENITADGLDETSLCIGDVVRIGDVVFEVTAPRMPCFKLSWRLGQGPDFLKHLIASGLVGVYLKVKTPGYLKAGDEVRIEPAGKTRITVAQVARMIGDLRVEDLPAARETLMLGELGGMSRMLLGHKINNLEDGSRCQAHRWQGWRPFRIADIARVGHDATSVVLVPEDGRAIAPFRAGQHLVVKLPLPTYLSRTWSLSEFAPYPARYRITVRRAEGLGSRWIADEARVGDIVQARAPAGRFVLDRSSFFRVVLISAGVGVTPMLSMLRAHALRGLEAPALHWLHSAKDSAALLHAGEVDEILKQNAAFKRQVHFTSPTEADDPSSYDRRGRITPADLEEILRSPFPAGGGAVMVPGEYSHFYVCGPVEFNNMVIDTLVRLGVERQLIFTERFVRASSGRSGSLRTEPSSVRFERSGRTLEWDPKEDLTLLELAESAGIDAPFSCRAGDCGTCEARLIEGSVKYDPEPTIPIGSLHCLPCSARPSSEHVCVDL